MAETGVDTLQFGRHPLYHTFKERWLLYQSAYDGVFGLLDQYLVERHERESERNFRRRLNELYDFNFSKGVVDLFHHYLFRKSPTRQLGPLADDELWLQFRDDCDLWGNDFEVFMLEQQRMASILGHTGILVDKYPASVSTRAQEIETGLYPYLTAYSPLDILDWRYERDAGGRPFLAYLKLRDDDGGLRIWTPRHWQHWRTDLRGGEPVLENEGANPLGEIPFVFLYNLRHVRWKSIGISDISDIAPIDLSIVRNLSQCEEVIGLAGFPMMRKPMRELHETGPDLAGVSAVLEFNPEHGESGKPDWLHAAVGESVSAIMEWISFKVKEIYRTANAGSAVFNEQSSSESGTALRTRFQLLNSRLVAKGNNVSEAERGIIWYWLKWQQQERLYDGILVERPKSYEVDDLSSDLGNALNVRQLIEAPEFGMELQKRVARNFLDHLDDKRANEVLKNIEQTVMRQTDHTDAIREPASA